MTTSDPHAAPPAPRPGLGGRGLAVGAAALVLVLLAVGTIPRVLRHRALVAEADAATAAVPAVTVAAVRTGEATGELSLPATVAGLHETGLHPRSSGYVRRWLADMGTTVRAGEVLAEIETPELDQELSQARASLAQAQATLGLARATVERLRDLVGEGAITRQDFDERQAAFDVAQASAASARANVERLQALQRFGQITAPFAGVVTARNVDVGALVAPGSAGSAARPMFTLAQVDTVRVLANVPQSAAPGVRAGLPATVTVPELGREGIRGHVARTAQALDPATRMLPIEIRVANPDRRLLPGMYARATLATRRDAPPLLVPANTLIMGADGPLVAVVRDGRVRITKVALGRDLGTEVEVLDGVEAGAALVVNPGDAVTEGAAVRTRPAPLREGAGR